jgi:hypothetical protein
MTYITNVTCFTSPQSGSLHSYSSIPFMTFCDVTDKIVVMEPVQPIVGKPHCIEFPSLQLKDIPTL